MKFWDSSAIIPLCLNEPFSLSMRTLLMEDPAMALWWGTSVECCSAFARLRREGRFSREDEASLCDILKQLVDCCTVVEPVDEVRQNARLLLLRNNLRAADALQLGAALVLTEGNPSEFGFVCFDNRLRDAARKEGFTLFPQQL
jgi:predicted nucleic acid-binding protein